MPILELKNVCKGFGHGPDRLEVLENINLTIDTGEFIAIVGYSGSGKTTLISLINGLMMPDSGKILLNGKEIKGPGPDRGTIFQNYSLLPWLTVTDNISLAVEQVFPDWPAKKRKEQVAHYVEMVNLTPAKHKRPAELSGGMRQRVCVARALAMNPEILLLDEPLSALDALTRGSLQQEIINIWEADKKTAVMITNDVDEGILMADRIIPLNPGPKATLGPEFKVDLPRPRIKSELNQDPAYKKLRNDVYHYLGDINPEKHKDEEIDNFELPELVPTEFDSGRGIF